MYSDPARQRAAVREAVRRYRARKATAARRAEWRAQQRSYRATPRGRARKKAERARRRARLHGVALVDLIAIAERDDWRCHLCKRRVALKDLSLDHLVPLIHGGAHTALNVALAHRRCNSRRGAGRIPAQLRLLG